MVKVRELFLGISTAVAETVAKAIDPGPSMQCELNTLRPSDAYMRR